MIDSSSESAAGLAKNFNFSSIWNNYELSVLQKNIVIHRIVQFETRRHKFFGANPYVRVSQETLINKTVR